MKTRLEKLEKTFFENVSDVHKLMNFDRDVLGFAITNLQDLSTRLKNSYQIDNPNLLADNTLKSLENIRKNDSLRPRYQVIFNQAIVLLVSYFGSTIEDIFKAGIDALLEQQADSDLLHEEIKLSFREIKDANWHLRDIAADLLVEKKDLSFQDMQAISRTFKTYLGVSIEKDVNVHNIILAQACRHVIVHAGGIASDRLVRQISNASPRELKTAISKGEHIQFTPMEVETVSKSMTAYVKSLALKVQESLSLPPKGISR